METDSEPKEPQSTNSDLEVVPSPNKRQKTLSPISTSKGKEKIEDEFMDSDSDICGICFSEERKAIRGWIDSCNHYFCFVCIMEWSKVESRCPMCKQRFSTIRRKPKNGVFLRERIVHVPVRNQVWHPHGNQTNEISDPYSQVNCTECQSSVDENLLLLCDLCDSAAHTYCVGLGGTVPEGDWYCHDCIIIRSDHFSTELDTDGQYQDSRTCSTVSVAVKSVSISEIVQESSVQEADRSLGKTSSCPDQCSLPVPNGKSSSRTRVIDSSVRTLSRCRNVHKHIRVLRENWGALRRGSLGFSSNLPDSDGKSNKKQNGAVICDKSNTLQSSSSMSCLQNITKDAASCDGLNNKGSYDIDRAWKMMDIAKSVQRAREITQNFHQVSDYQSENRSVQKEAVNTSSNFSMSKGNPFQRKNLEGVALEKNFKCKLAHKKHSSKKSEEQKLGRDALETSCCKKLPSTRSSRYSELPLATQVNRCHENGGVMHGTSSNLSGGIDNIRSVSLTESSSGSLDPSYNRPEFCASSCCKDELSKEGRIDKSSAKNMVRKDEDAKCEVQSLVKLNMKLLSKEKQLGVEEFKEVARLATHTILAACGLEHKKSSVRCFPHSICRHKDQSKQLRMSNLMPSSCRECFYVFVKDVVSSIMTEKQLKSS